MAGVVGLRVVGRILDRPLDHRGLRRRQGYVEFEQHAVHLAVRVGVARRDPAPGHGLEQRRRRADTRGDLQERYRRDRAHRRLHDAAGDAVRDVAVGPDIRHRMGGELTRGVGVGRTQRPEGLDHGHLELLLVDRELIRPEGAGAIRRAEHPAQGADAESEELLDVGEGCQRLRALRSPCPRPPVAQGRHRHAVAPCFELPLQPGQGHRSGVYRVAQGAREIIVLGSARVIFEIHHRSPPVCEDQRFRVSIRPHARTSGDRVGMWGHLAVFAGRVPVPANDRPDAVMPPLLRMS